MTNAFRYSTNYLVSVIIVWIYKIDGNIYKLPVVSIEDFNYIDSGLVDTNTNYIVNYFEYLLFTVTM